MKYKVCVITGTRAEFGLLEPLLRKLHNDKEIDLQLVVTGSHLSPAFGNTQSEIKDAGLPIYARIPVNIEGDKKVDMAVSTGEAVVAFAKYFEKHQPQLLIILGDRFEIFSACTAASLLGIPIAHLYGGETTEGAVDEFLRHSITKMSYYHFTACEEYRRRVIQLGEDPDRVFNVGSLGVENIINLPEISIEELMESLNFDLSGNYSIVTFHPVTLEENTSEIQLRQLIDAMDEFKDMKYIITKANADAGGRTINQIWDNASMSHMNWVVVPSLGAKRYLTALKYSQMIIGNSSSGIIEAPALHVPTVNIGDRQKGRMMSESIICCKPETEDIVKAMRKALSPDFREAVTKADSYFGNGNTSDKIMVEVKKFLHSGIKEIKKSFYDIKQ